ncbi:hypothetical protein AGMMS50239_26660 [Bacteroidia bacterium]|nr:hypothetical protein AGMMS50239_26660 [Bacteroidia bacterium]
MMLCVGTMQAQKLSLLVHSETGEPQSFALSAIGKITFSEGTTSVLFKNGDSNNIALSTISKLTFSETGGTDIRLPEAASTLKFYPNPVRDDLFVSSGSKIETITVFNLQGGVVLHNNEQSSSVTLSLGFLSKGIYLIQVKRADAISTHKIIKQ